MSNIKTCIKCGSKEFNKSGDCKDCAKKRAEIYRNNNKEKIKQYREDHRDYYIKKRKERYEENKEEEKEYAREYHKMKSKDQSYRDAAKERSALWVKNNKEKAAEYAKAYQEKNKEKLQEYYAEYYKKNADKKNANSSKWLKENREKANKTKSIYRKNNPQDVMRDRCNRKYKEKKVGGKLSKGISKKLFELQKGKCPCCGLSLGSDYHVDHIMPLALGGANTDDNVQLLRAECNLKKNALHPVTYMQSKGFLL